MDLREIVAGVRALGYQHKADRTQPAYQHLRAVLQEFQQVVPAGMQVLVSGSGQSLPVVPWIAVLNREVTTTAQEGLYVVYLYSQDLQRVYLSMNQGATQHRRNAEAAGAKGRAAEKLALAELAKESTLIRGALSSEALDGLQPEIKLGSRLFLPEGYELGNIAAIEYDPALLPDDKVLQADLDRLLTLYDTCVQIKNELVIADPNQVRTTATSAKARKPPAPKPPMFRPKDSSTYLAEVKKQMQSRGRRHEELLNAFAPWLSQRGFVVANNVHPRDLVVEHGDVHWLIEAKTVYANAEYAVREAIGQLYSYRHFHYREQAQPDPTLVALFTGPVGDAFVQLMNSLGIECIWQAGRTWEGRAPAGQPSLLAAAQAAQKATV